MQNRYLVQIGYGILDPDDAVKYERTNPESRVDLDVVPNFVHDPSGNTHHDGDLVWMTLEQVIAEGYFRDLVVTLSAEDYRHADAVRAAVDREIIRNPDFSGTDFEIVQGDATCVSWSDEIAGTKLLHGVVFPACREIETPPGISIVRGDTVLAHHTSESPMSSYGQPVWVVLDSDPAPGPATWRQRDHSLTVEILGTRARWLIVRQPDRLLCGILWSDGSYYADLLADAEGTPTTELRDGIHVRNTIVLNPDDPDNLGSVVG
jgi:hypothetical protein